MRTCAGSAVGDDTAEGAAALGPSGCDGTERRAARFARSGSAPFGAGSDAARLRRARGAPDSAVDGEIEGGDFGDRDDFFTATSNFLGYNTAGQTGAGRASYYHPHR
jgi:hypothetical protein